MGGCTFGGILYLAPPRLLVLNLRSCSSVGILGKIYLLATVACSLWSSRLYHRNNGSRCVWCMQPKENIILIEEVWNVGNFCGLIYD